MSITINLETPENFDFRSAVTGHGWYALRPFDFDDDREILRLAMRDSSGAPVSVSISASESGGVCVSARSSADDLDAIRRIVGHILRFDEDLTEFYRMTNRKKTLHWIAEVNAGRLLRSPTVWEDLVKTICTTNCSWALTKIMVSNLVEHLGDAAEDGAKAFPTPHSMASQSENFYRDVIRAGYRAPYLIELAERVASGDLDPESWLYSELSTPDLKKEMKKVKGCGDYAAENLLKLVGRYDGLALDSWLRGSFYARYRQGAKCPDSEIEDHYRKFGKWRGLAIWCDLSGR